MKHSFHGALKARGPSEGSVAGELRSETQAVSREGRKPQVGLPPLADKVSLNACGRVGHAVEESDVRPRWRRRRVPDSSRPFHSHRHALCCAVRAYALLQRESSWSPRGGGRKRDMGRTHVHHRIVRKITGFPNRFRFRLRGTDGGRNECAHSRQHRESGRDGRTEEPDGEHFLRARTNIFHGTSPEKGTVRRAQSTLSSMLERSSPDPFPEDGIAPRAKRFRLTRSFHENQTERPPAFRIPEGKRTPGRLLQRAPFSLLKARHLLGLLARIFRRPQEKTV